MTVELKVESSLSSSCPSSPICSSVLEGYKKENRRLKREVQVLRDEVEIREYKLAKLLQPKSRCLVFLPWYTQAYRDACFLSLKDAKYQEDCCKEDYVLLRKVERQLEKQKREEARLKSRFKEEAKRLCSKILDLEEDLEEACKEKKKADEQYEKERQEKEQLKAEKQEMEMTHMSREKSWMLQCFRLEKEKKRAERAAAVAASTAVLSSTRGSSSSSSYPHRGNASQISSSSTRTGRGGGGSSECAGCLWKEKELRDLDQKLRKCEAEKAFCDKRITSLTEENHKLLLLAIQQQQQQLGQLGAELFYAYSSAGAMHLGGGGEQVVGAGGGEQVGVVGGEEKTASGGVEVEKDDRRPREEMEGSEKQEEVSEKTCVPSLSVSSPIEEVRECASLESDAKQTERGGDKSPPISSSSPSPRVDRPCMEEVTTLESSEPRESLASLKTADTLPCHIPGSSSQGLSVGEEDLLQHGLSLSSSSFVSPSSCIEEERDGEESAGSPLCTEMA